MFFSQNNYWLLYRFCATDSWMARAKIHEKVRQQIEEFIAGRALEAGSKLPSETDLASRLNVSRSTVRNALRTLEQEGKIERTPGRGTIVRKARLGQLIGKLTGFTEEMRLRGLKPTSRLIQATRTTPSAPVKALLQLDSEPVWKLKRVRCAEHEPIAVETCYISCSLLSEKEVAALNTGSLYELLERRGRVPVMSEQSIEAAQANSDDATLLNIEVGSPILQFERLSFDARGEPVEFVVSSYRGDKYRVYVLLRK
jgi:GntR family transcriptional regulator